MKGLLAVALRVLGLPTLVLVAVIAVAPGRAALASHVYLVVVAGVALASLVVALGRSLRAPRVSTFESGLTQRRPPAERVKQLERLEREVTLGRQNAWDLHTRLRPTLRETAAGLLAARRGIDLEREPQRAASVLGTDAWELVRPDHTPPQHRHAPGVDVTALDAAISALERL